jgi:hypothetical protein
MGRMKSIWMCWILYTYKRQRRQKAIAIAWVHQGQCQLYNNPPPPKHHNQIWTTQTTFEFTDDRDERSENTNFQFPFFFLFPNHPAAHYLLGVQSTLVLEGFRLFVMPFSSRISTPRLLVGPTLKDVCKQKHAIWTGSMASSSSSTKPIFVYPAVYTLCDVASSCLTSFTASAFGCRSSSSSSSIT